MSAIDPGNPNSEVWAEGRFVGGYANRDLRPAEVLFLLRYRQDLTGAVLELGCGAGRLTGYLAETAATCYGMDLSPGMLAECRRRYPAVELVQGDFRDLSHWDDESLDTVVASCNVLDILSDAARRETLRAIHRVLRPGGLLMMSSHNRAYLPRLRGPLTIRPDRPDRMARDLVLAPRNLVRDRRLRPLEMSTDGYAIVSDGAHGYTLVHYFIDPAAQRRQLSDEGFETVQCLGLDGQEITDGDSAPTEVELHYFARRR
jgi:SAM-dependent methyltransferase